MLYNITPVPKPRQTQRDKWAKRPCVLRYHAFADTVRVMRLTVCPGDSVAFVMPMPKSWSKKKKARMDGKPHLQVPDIDNLLKSVLDACYNNDSHIWRIGNMQKTWGYNGSIEIVGQD